MYSLGKNDYGQLGHSADLKIVGIPTYVLNMKNVAQVAAGGSHAIFVTCIKIKRKKVLY